MTYTAAQRDAFIAAIRPGPIHMTHAAADAGITTNTAAEILAKGCEAKMIEIKDLGPGEFGMLIWRGA